LKAGAVYERDYLLGTSFARPIIAKRLVEIAKARAQTLSATAAQARATRLHRQGQRSGAAPDMQIIAPWRIWNIKSREEEIEYAEAHNIPLKINRETNYSKDKNLWHLSHEGLDLEDPANEPQYNKPGFLEIGQSPEQAPDKPTYITISFEKGVPVAVDGEKMDGVTMIEKLNKIGGENGVGLADIVENRLVGMKSRGVYENPAGSILYRAHEVLETLTLDRDTMHYKEQVALRYAELVYFGRGSSPSQEGARRRSFRTTNVLRRRRSVPGPGPYRNERPNERPYRNGNGTKLIKNETGAGTQPLPSPYPLRPSLPNDGTERFRFRTRFTVYGTGTGT